MCQVLRRSLDFAGAATFALGGILSSACSNTVKPEVGSIATAGNNPATISMPARIAMGQRKTGKSSPNFSTDWCRT